MKSIVLLAMVALCVAQKSTEFLGASEMFASSGSLGASEMFASSGSVDVRSPYPVEVAQEGGAVFAANVGSETMEYPAPALLPSAPLVHLPKGAQEVVDVPHADIRLPGNSIQNKDLHLNLPTPVVEAPQPIIQEKEVIFRLPQPVFYIPKPIVQHKPIVYRVPHTLRTITPQVNLREYLFKVPSAQITGKSSYTQTMPRAW